jgi:predicted regulator of Ras-like GTPase activity (Roadblock/LC7/MglB family)
MKNFGNDLIKFSQIMKKTKKDCTLMIRSREGSGHIFFKDGQLFNAKTGKANGKEAILEILAWNDVECKTKRGCKEKDHEITTPLPQLLKESRANAIKNDKNDEELMANSETEEQIYDEGLDNIYEPEQINENFNPEEDTIKLEDYVKEGEMVNPKEAQLQRFKEGTMSRIDRLNQILADLQAIAGDIEACAVVSVDGLIMASNLPRGLEEDSVAAMSAVMMSMGERTALELERGKTEQLFVKGDDGYVVTMRAGDDAVLLVMARKEAKLGLVFLDLSRAAIKVQHVLA